MNAADVDVPGYVFVQGKLGLPHLDDEGGLFLVHPDGGTREESHGGEPVQSGVVFGGYVGHFCLLSWGEFQQAQDQGSEYLFCPLTALTRGYELSVGTPHRVTQQGAYTGGNLIIEEVLKLTGTGVHGVVFHRQYILQESFCQTVASYHLLCLFPACGREDDEGVIHMDEFLS